MSEPKLVIKNLYKIFGPNARKFVKAVNEDYPIDYSSTIKVINFSGALYAAKILFSLLIGIFFAIKPAKISPKFPVGTLKLIFLFD